MIRKTLALIALLPVAAHAQVGHDPQNSPYRDVATAMRVTGFAGWYAAASDPAKVLPQSGPLVGVRWNAHIGGPAEVGVRFAMVLTERNVLDPAQGAQNRLVEERSINLGLADVSLTFNLTGNKSWRRLVPYVQMGLGLASDFDERDVGGFRHGTEFTLAYGGGVRFVPSDRFELRAELGSYFYNLEYPSSYFQPGADQTSVLPPTTPRDAWRNNWAFTVGVSIAPFR